MLYSWRNTIIAEVDGKSAGMLTAYDGRYYHEMRMRTMSLVKQHLGVEFPGMEDEAVAGDYKQVYTMSSRDERIYSDDYA